MFIGQGRRAILAAAVFGIIFAYHGTVSAQTNIVDDWSKVAPPPAPDLKLAVLDAKTTALVVMDFVKQSCNEQGRPHCVALIPKVKAMIDTAKAKNAMIIWTLPPGPKPEDFLPQIAPPAGTKLVVGPVDKFVGTDLDKELKDKGITTLVVTGTSAHGAVLYTASQAAIRGFKVIVPVDGMSATAPYAEQATAYILTTAPVLSGNVTLTRGDLITYR
ncbi:MAG TPA: cysteine hydrolase [Stellaceae bacterium]|jgi:nicotinamidase-related amidase|nr:cysteine hydrolase [Stellaceae bacterium]